MEDIRIGVIGYGYWGPNLVRNFSLLNQVVVAAVVDHDARKLQLAHAAYPALQTHTDAEALIHDRTIDAVAIATPVSSHFALAKAALEHGKHVLIEKPMTRTRSEAEELLTLAQKHGCTLMVGHTFIYAGAVEKIHGIIRNRELGNLYSFDSTRYNLGLLQQDINVLWDLASHDLAILLYLIDERPIAVQAFGQRHVGKTQQEIGMISLLYESGFHAHIRSSWLSPVKIRLTFLVGSKKMVVYDDVDPSEKVRVYDKGVALQDTEVTAFNPLYRSGDVLIPSLDRSEPLQKETAHFIECIRSRERPRSDGLAGLEVVSILEAADQSMLHGSTFIPITLPTWSTKSSRTSL